ncbi:hypothetical protein [Myroides sp. WP-1]|uniref:hypothetical protein n=1 Tax=Myroides sp. WP-1 TaxID=2759944 RepID=UPI0015FDF6AB|nr:hypothetical protein [Myroides sp. WP-1]MBB1140230.1 hypothetical protein [Myroides sp. WP-1]
MKKITLLAAVLGASYFANAQVGIGTPTPITSTQLDVTAKDKGILIPRVALTSLDVFNPIEGAQTESLLVYNSNGVAIPTGFYYWVDSKWNRIVGKAELDQVIENLGDNITNLEADVKNLQAVINYILPSNPSNDDTTPETHTTVVYKDGKFYTVTYDATTQTYTTQEINFEDLVNGAETKTFMREISNAEGKIIGVIYFSEQTILDWLEAADENTVDNIPNTAPGATTIKVTDIVVNNIQEILESPTTITITTVEGDKTFTTVEEYLQYITQFSNGNVIYSEIADPANPGQTIWAFQYWDEAANKYQIIDIQGLVEAAETNTTIVSYNNKQYYLSESYIKAGGETNPANWTSVPAGAIHVDVVGGVVNNIQEILESPTTITITTVEGDKTFTTVEEYLQYISQYSNGNVIYTEIADPANPGQTIWAFQYWDEAANKYQVIDIQGLVEAAETNTTIVSYNNKQYYLSESYIKAGGETNPANWTSVPAGAIHVDVVGGVINNIQEILESPTDITITTVEGDKTFTTVEEYLQYISQYSNGNVIYTEIADPANPGQTIWAFQYWDEAANKYQVIDIQGLVEAAETNTTIVSYNNKQYYLSESYIKAGGETNPANWTSVPAGAIHVDVVGGVINNIQEILESPTDITITTVEGDKTFTTVEEYLQYITQFSNGNVIYTQIDDPANAGQKIWVFQYWDEATNSYETINLRDLVAATETKTQIKRSEVLADGTLPAFEAVRTAPVAGDVKQGEIFYEYSAEGDQKDYINMTEDILNSINNNEEIKNAITNVLNQGGNVYFGDHDGDDSNGNTATPHVFYQVITNPDGTKTNKEIELPASFLVNLIKKYKDIVKQELGDHITNEGDTVYTGDTYNGYKVYLGKGATTIVAYSAEATPVTLTLENGAEIRQVLSIKLLTAAGHIVTSNTTDVVINGTEINFNIGVGNQYMMLTPGTYEVVVEFTSNEEVQL